MSKINMENPVIGELFSDNFLWEPLTLPCGRPKCIVEGCNSPRQHTGNRRANGSVIYRNECEDHHRMRYDMEGNYRYKRKNICENVDGRLGYKCNNHIIDKCQLTVDHIDENNKNNDITNLHTVCSNCHNFKTKFFRIYKDKPGLIAKIFTENIKFFELNPDAGFSPNYYKVIKRELDTDPFSNINTKKRVKKEPKMAKKLLNLMIDTNC